LSENHLPVKCDNPTQCERIVLTGRNFYIQPLILHLYTML